LSVDGYRRRCLSWALTALIAASASFSSKPDGAIQEAPSSWIGRAPMLLSPFRPGTTHVMELGPVQIGHRAQPAPPSGDQVDAAVWRRDRKQHSRHVRICKPGHLDLPSVRLKHSSAAPSWRFQLTPSRSDVMDVSSVEATVPLYGGLIGIACWGEPLILGSLHLSRQASPEQTSRGRGSIRLAVKHHQPE
jgi:hypothetical protein